MPISIPAVILSNIEGAFAGVMVVLIAIAIAKYRASR